MTGTVSFVGWHDFICRRKWASFFIVIRLTHVEETAFSMFQDHIFWGDRLSSKSSRRAWLDIGKQQPFYDYTMSLPNFPSRPDVFSTPEKRRPRNSRIFEGSSRGKYYLVIPNFLLFIDDSSGNLVTPKSPRKRLYSSADDTIVYSPSTRVYNITELLEHILEYCDWGSLTAVGITLTKLRTIRNRVINKRVEFFLSLFFDRDCLDRFFLKLKALRCAVFGGIVRCIMSAGNQAFFEAYPRELYIVAPFDVNSVYSGSWRRFLGSQDFEFSSDMSGDRLASSSIKRIIHSKQVRENSISDSRSCLMTVSSHSRERWEWLSM